MSERISLWKKKNEDEIEPKMEACKLDKEESMKERIICIEELVYRNGDI